MRAVRIVLFTVLAAAPLIIASPALASAVPSCFNSEPVAVRTEFFAAAPDGSEMEDEGEAMMNKLANNGTGNSGNASGELISIADRYGYGWDCATESFVLENPPTTVTSTTMAPTTATTTTIQSTTTSSSTTTTRPAAIGYPPINIVLPTSPTAPSTTLPQTNTTVATGPTAPSESVGISGAPASSASPTTTSTTGTAPTAQTDLQTAPASHDGGHGGSATVLLIAAGVAAVFGIGGGVLIGRRRGGSPLP